MKKITMAVGLVGTLLLGGCASHIKISKEQSATMSQQALDTLKTFKYLKLPIINANDKMRLMGREQFATYEKWHTTIRKIKRDVCQLTSRHQTPHLILPDRTQAHPPP